MLLINVKLKLRCFAVRDVNTGSHSRILFKNRHSIFLKQCLSRHCSSDCLGSVETITALYQSRKTSCTKLVISITQVQNRSLK